MFGLLIFVWRELAKDRVVLGLTKNDKTQYIIGCVVSRLATSSVGPLNLKAFVGFLAS